MSTYIYTKISQLPVEALSNIDINSQYVTKEVLKDHLEVEFQNSDYPLLITTNRVDDYEIVEIINDLELPVYYWNLDNEGGHPSFQYGDVIINIGVCGIQRMIITNIH